MAGYVYRGTEPYQADEPKPVRRKVPLVPLDTTLCGTNAGYHQHYRYRQDACPGCHAAHKAYDAIYRARRKAAGYTRSKATSKQ